MCMWPSTSDLRIKLFTFPFLRRLFCNLVFKPSSGSWLLKWTARYWLSGMMIKTVMVIKISARRWLCPAQGWMRNWGRLTGTLRQDTSILKPYPAHVDKALSMIMMAILWRTWHWSGMFWNQCTAMSLTTWSHSVIHQPGSGSTSYKPQDREGCTKWTINTRL